MLQAEHEAACPIASFLRMMAPLQAVCQELESECHELRARAAALVHLVVDQQAQMQSQQAQMEQIQTHNEQLQRQVAALWVSQFRGSDTLNAAGADDNAAGSHVSCSLTRLSVSCSM